MGLALVRVYEEGYGDGQMSSKTKISETTTPEEILRRVSWARNTPSQLYLVTPSGE